MESWEQSQARGSPTDTLASNSLLSISPLTQSQSTSNGNMGAFQVLHAHLEESRIGTELRQEPWVPKHVFWKCQENDFPPDAKKGRPLGSKAGECGSEDSVVETAEARKKSHPVEDRELKDTFLSLPQNEQLPLDSYFRKSMRQFFQWINLKRKRPGKPSVLVNSARH